MITPREQKRLDELALAFDRRSQEAMAAGMNDDLLTLNRAAAGRARGLGFPHKAHERFTYVDTTGLMASEMAWRPSKPGKVLTATTAKVLIVDGRFVSPPGSIVGTPGATVVRLGDALSHDPKLNALLAARGVTEEDIFSSLAEAAVLDGAFIDIPGGASSFTPITVDLVSDTQRSIAHPRLVVRIGDGAKATLLIRTVGDQGGYYENGVVDLIVGRHATAEFLVIGDDHPEGRRLTRYRGGVGGGSDVTMTFMTVGAASSRISFDLTLDGEKSSASVSHLATLVGSAQAHVWGRIVHRAPDAASRMLFKNVVAGTSHASVDASVAVEPTGPGAVSRQEIHSLILDHGARADAKPTLTIGNDDVVCSHGATAGQLDDEALRYLQSRGIDETTGRRLLIDAFRREVAERVENEPLRGIAFDTLAKGGRS